MPVVPKARILIIDNDESIRFTFQKFLNRDGYCHVSISSSAAEALSFSRNNTFDLVICDAMLESAEKRKMIDIKY